MNKTVLGLALGTALALGATTSALAEDLDFTLENQSSRNLMVFQTSPSGVDSWEEDVLGSYMLPSGNYINVTIADGRDHCVYDMRFIMEDEAVLEHYEVDLCELGTYTLYDQ